VDEIRPWDRQPFETSKAYEAFSIYRDMGAKRTVRGTAEALTKSEQLIKGWSGKNDWVRRAAAFDSLPARKTEEAYTEMAARVAAQHERLATKLAERLERNLDLLPEGADPSIKWSTAHGAARQGHQLASDLSKPESGVKKEISDQIAALLAKLSE
jgi:hypothetical protein